MDTFVARSTESRPALIGKALQGRVAIVTGSTSGIGLGIAKALDQASERTRTRTGHRRGKEGYLAPEQLDSRAVVVERTDVYGVGMVLKDALVGEWPPELDAVLARALDPAHDRRYASASELEAALDPFVAQTKWGAGELAAGLDRWLPRAAVGPLAVRAQAKSLPASERLKATTALGFIPTREAAMSLLDVAQNGGSDLRENQALWWLLNYKDSRWADMGVDAELKRRGLFDPDTVKVSDITVPEPAQGSSLPAVADIAKLRGNAKRGAEAAAACLMCHRLGGRGVDYGPAIEGFASRQTRDVVITAIVNPSNDIAHGYEGSEITLVDGRKLHGLVLSGGNPLIVQSTGGVTQLIPASLVKERKRLGRSLMMSADQLGLSPQQIADITGQTSVNVNRVFADLERQGLIRREGREIMFDDWDEMRRVASFSPGYLQ